MQVSSLKETAIESSQAEKQNDLSSSAQSNAVQEVTQPIIKNLNNDQEINSKSIDNDVTEIRIRNQRDTLAQIANASADTHIRITALIIVGLFGIIIAGVGAGLQKAAGSNYNMQLSGIILTAIGLTFASATGITGGVKGVQMSKKIKNSVQANTSS